MRAVLMASIVAASLGCLIGTVVSSRFEFAIGGERSEFVYRLDRRTGQISRWAQDGTCIAFQRHCTFEQSPQ